MNKSGTAEIFHTELKINLIQSYDQKVPHITKYMGSKRRILDFVISAIDDIYEGTVLCDLFAGTSILSGALGGLIPMHSNDIQEYSSVLSKTYLADYKWSDYSPNLLNEIVRDAKLQIKSFSDKYPELSFIYSPEMTIKNFVNLENEQQLLIDKEFPEFTHHLFVKYYSGTYWSFEQCLCIDALRMVADKYKGSPIFNVILSSLIYSMSYCSQSTGHYAQYRDAKSESSKNDILIYRLRDLFSYFELKFNQLREHFKGNSLNHKVTSLDYRKCLESLEPGTLVYADPPYGFVHYSRFYHALETLVKYDYPKVDHKGRYRSDRHQSPFGKKTEVKKAFVDLFTKIKDKRSSLILSYSNTGMISLEEIMDIGRLIMGGLYDITFLEENHKHSTMGRSDDKTKDVKEYLIIAKIKI